MPVLAQYRTVTVVKEFTLGGATLRWKIWATYRSENAPPYIAPQIRIALSGWMPPVLDPDGALPDLSGLLTRMSAYEVGIDDGELHMARVE